MEQKNSPKNGDWVSTVIKDMRKLDINLSFDEIMYMSKHSFKKIISKKCDSAALFYLKNQINVKGKEMKYEKLEMQHYMRSKSLTIEEKKGYFLIQSRMTDIKTNMKNKFKNVMCVACETFNLQVEETQEHIIICEILNKNNKRDFVYNIYTHKTEEIKKIVTLFLENMKEREKCLN